MRPEILEKIQQVAGPNQIDLSVITDNSMPTMDLPEMPEISVDTLYSEIKDKVIILSSDEILDLMHRLLMDRIQVQSDVLPTELQGL